MSKPSLDSGKVVIISGPSGSGKSTICRHLRKHPLVWMSISATTRPKRPREVNGQDYYFLDQKTFEKWIQENKFVEYAKVIDHYYGTPLVPVEEKVSEGKIVLLDIDIQGHEIIKEKGVLEQKGIPSISIFILPPSMEELEKRLRDRKTEKEEEIQKRLQRARKEMEKASQYDFQVLNDDVNRATQKVCDIIGLSYEELVRLEEGFIQ